MRIPIFVKSDTEQIWECVAITDSVYGHFRVCGVIRHPSDDGLTARVERRYADLQRWTDGNQFLVEEVSPRDYVEAINFWKKAYLLSFRLDRRGFIGVTT